MKNDRKSLIKTSPQVYKGAYGLLRELECCCTWCKNDIWLFFMALLPLLHLLLHLFLSSILRVSLHSPDCGLYGPSPPLMHVFYSFAENEDPGPEATVGSLAGHQQSPHKIQEYIQVPANATCFHSKEKLQRVASGRISMT